jgi:hypothetical protein
MSRITTPLRRSLFVKLLVIAGTVLLLQACGGGGGGGGTPPPPPPPPPPPVTTSNPGYFDNVSTNGGAHVYQTDNTTELTIVDLQGMVHGSQFTLVSVANNLAYYATFTSISGNAYTANVAIYQNNIPAGTTTVSGTLVAGTGGSLTGTFGTSGTGYGRGTFALDYSLANTPDAAVSRIVKNWLNNTPIDSLSSFQVDNTGAFHNTLVTIKGNFLSCNINGTITPVTNTALYQVSMTLTNCDSTKALANGSYTGLATSRTQSANDDRLVVTVTNGVYSMNGEFQ